MTQRLRRGAPGAARRSPVAAAADGLRGALWRLRDGTDLARIGRLPDPAPPAAAGRPDPVGTLVIAVHDMGMGGAQTVARSFARWLLARSGWEPRFVALRGGPFRPRFEAIAPTLCLDFDGGADPVRARALLRDFAGPAARVLLVNSAASGRILDLWPEEIPAVAFVHELPKMLRRHAEGLERIARRCRRIVGGSRAVAETLGRDFGLAPGRLASAYAFIEPEPPAPDAAARRADWRRRHGIGPDELLVCGCGVLHWRKSPALFIEIAARARALGGTGLRFLWIGGGPDRAACERRIDAAGLRGCLRITGYAADIRPILAGADLFLLPSEEDPFPLAALEAAACGLPVICFAAAGGTPELVARGCGTAVPFLDAAAMAETVLAYAADPARREREGAAGRAAVQAEFTAEAAGPALLAEIEAAIAGAAS